MIATFFRGNPWSISGYIEDDPNKRSIAYLDQYSTERWDTVLHYMVRVIIHLIKNAEAVVLWAYINKVWLYIL